MLKSVHATTKSVHATTKSVHAMINNFYFFMQL